MKASIAIPLGSLGIFAYFAVAPAGASQWYEDAGNSWAHVSSNACDVMTSAITHWFTKDGPYQTGGNPATAKMYAVMTNSTVSQVLGGKTSGYRQLEVHNLSNKDGSTLAGIYDSVAQAGVPFFLQVVPVPAQVGSALTLIDWAVKNNAKQSKASELAALMTSGGELENGFTVNKNGNETWLVRQIYYNVSVNNQPRRYLICTWQYPVAIK
jgi:hypothetical protein